MCVLFNFHLEKLLRVLPLHELPDNEHIRGLGCWSELQRLLHAVSAYTAISSRPFRIISGDPHIKGAHGDKADFKGINGAVYNALSARNLSLNLKFEHSTFLTPFSKLNVHGSWVRAAFHTLRTGKSGRILQVFYHSVDPHRATITEGCTAPYCKSTNGTRWVLAGGAVPFVVENVHVSLARKTLVVSTGQWLTTSRSTVGRPHIGKLRMHVEIKPTYPEGRDPVAAHGLLGQTYDRDHLRVNGRQDSYSRLDDGRSALSRSGAGGEVTTRANAEGALEGVAADYRMASDFAVDFRFSRFDAVAAAVRNVSALSGAQAAIPTHSQHSHENHEQEHRARGHG